VIAIRRRSANQGESELWNTLHPTFPQRLIIAVCGGLTGSSVCQLSICVESGTDNRATQRMMQ
jgi:hypothetical protein